jgi:hypothetical protein
MSPGERSLPTNGRVLIALGYVALVGGLDAMSYLHESLPAGVSDLLGLLGLASVLVGVAVGFVIYRGWALALPLLYLPVSPVMLELGYTARYSGDEIDILSPAGLAFYFVTGLVVADLFIGTGLALRCAWERSRSGGSGDAGARPADQDGTVAGRG